MEWWRQLPQILVVCSTFFVIRISGWCLFYGKLHEKHGVKSAVKSAGNPSCYRCDGHDFMPKHQAYHAIYQIPSRNQAWLAGKSALIYYTIIIDEWSRQNSILQSFPASHAWLPWIVSHLARGPPSALQRLQVPTLAMGGLGCTANCATTRPGVIEMKHYIWGGSCSCNTYGSCKHWCHVATSNCNYNGSWGNILTGNNVLFLKQSN